MIVFKYGKKIVAGIFLIMVDMKYINIHLPPHPKTVSIVTRLSQKQLSEPGVLVAVSVQQDVE